MRSILFGALIGITLPFALSAQCGPLISNFPYHEDFEAGQGGWQAGGLNNDWTWGTPAKPVINAAASGVKCWVTGGLSGSFYSFGQRSYVESPCFDFSSLPHPYIHFKIWWESERHFDGTNLQYSLDNGTTWTNVGAIDDDTNCLNANWYNYSPINFLNNLATVRDGWSGNIQPSAGICVGGFGSAGWVEAKHCMPYLGGEPNVRFRFTFGAGTTCNNFDGVGFDDIYIENAPPIVADFTATCSGPNTYSFVENATNCPETWSWNFGDPASGAANTATAQFTSHTFSAPGVYTVTMSASSLCSGPSATVSHTVTILDLATQAVDVQCHGNADGTASVQINPAVGTASFQWSTTPVQNTSVATGLAPGTYSVTVSEPGICPATATATVVEPSALQHVVQTNGTSCGLNNGAASITASGGVGPYTYAWSAAGSGASASGLASGAYSVTITDSHNCADTAFFNITNSLSLLANVASISAVSCPGGADGSAMVMVNNAQAPLNYVWSAPGNNTATASGLSAGTYSVTVTDANQCTATTAINIAEPPAFQHIVTTTPALCGANTGGATVAVTGGTGPYQFLWTSGASSNPVTNIGMGNIGVTITDQLGCHDTASVAISGTPAAQAAIAGTSPATCFGNADGSATVALLSAAPPTAYLWSPGGGLNAMASGLAAGNYTVTVTDTNGCTATATAMVAQPLDFSPNISTTPAACGSTNGTAQVVQTGGTSPYTYAWPPGTGMGNTANGLASGTYLLTVTDSHACTDVITVNIGNIGGVQATLGSASPVTCPGGSDGSATIVTNGGISPYTFMWPGGVGNGAVAGNLAAGAYTVTVTDASSCISTVTAVIGSPPAFQHMVAVHPMFCSIANGCATIAESGGTPPYNYGWSPNVASGNAAASLTAGWYDVTVSDSHACTDTLHIYVDSIPHVQLLEDNTSDVTCFGGNNGAASVIASQGTAPYTYAWPGGGSGPSANSLAAGTYSVIVSDANACSASVLINIDQPAELQHSVIVLPSICNLPNGVVDIVETGGVPGYSYVWSPPTNGGSLATGLAAGQYGVSITDQNGCIDTVLLNLPGIPSVVASIGNVVDATCFGAQDGSISVNASIGTPPYTYNWSAGGSTGPVANGLPTGLYTVTVTDANQCTRIVSAQIMQPMALASTAMVTDAHCSGANGSATVVSTGGTAPYFYQWSPVGGTGAVATGLAQGTYQVAVSDQHGCDDTLAVVVANLPGVELNIAQVTEVSCFDENDGTASTQVNGGVPPFVFTWQPAAGNGPVASGLPAGPVVAIVQDATGCADTTTAVIPAPAPIVSEFSSMPVHCFGGHDGSITVDTTTGGTGPYQYSLNQAPQGSSGQFDNLETGIYLIETEDALGCRAVDTVQLPAPLPNAVDAGPDITIFLGEQVLMQGQVEIASTIVQYSWAPSEGLACPDCLNTTALPLETTTYTLTAVDNKGCVWSDEREIVVRIGEIYIPNAIRPESDALNDHFTLYAGKGVDEIVDLMIYDRWGELVFENHHFPPSQELYGWDGSFRGELVGSGVYVYLIKLRLIDGAESVLSGDVTVVR